jgi:hypothetical protein
MLNFVLKILFILILSYSLHSCANRGDAREFPPEPEKRIKKNLEEGRGFRISEAFGNQGGGSGNFEFASSNELWRASLDTIDFMPLASANYSGGIIITDWYSSGSNMEESIKISIRFLSNEVRSDALDIKVFYKKCGQTENCQISEKKGSLVSELNKKILSKAAVYKEQIKDKNFKPYKGKMKSFK